MPETEPPATAEARALVARWLPPGFALAAGDPGAPASRDPDTPPGAIEARAREFAAGRRAAREAAARAGLVLERLPMGADRAPVWPAGLTGSIAHAGGLCLAVVGPADWGNLGLDLEPERGLDPALHETILRPEERGIGAAEALAVFVVKEAAYKAQYPITRRLFDFQAMRVELRPGRFRAVLTEDQPPLRAGVAIEGFRGRAGGHVLALALCPRGRPSSDA